VGTDLFDLSTRLFKSHGILYLMADEIHAISGWQGQLKKLYDFSD
jgi:predicted AAA+ superfamily ATPase